MILFTFKKENKTLFRMLSKVEVLFPGINFYFIIEFDISLNFFRKFYLACSKLFCSVLLKETRILKVIISSTIWRINLLFTTNLGTRTKMLFVATVCLQKLAKIIERNMLLNITKEEKMKLFNMNLLFANYYNWLFRNNIETRCKEFFVVTVCIKILAKNIHSKERYL